ncbi:MAG TPA: TolC family protein [Candidatus Eisenbacteria bacterium]|nr:TolC family protein [Candidatus Eisenbacteria bacterium]
MRFGNRSTLRVLAVLGASLALAAASPAAGAEADSTAAPTGAAATARFTPDSSMAAVTMPTGGEIWSLARCIDEALKQNSDVRGAKARTAQASGGALGAWSNILPSVTTAAGYTESKPDKAGSVRSLDVITPTDTVTYFGNVTKQNFGSISASVGMNVLNISAWSQKKEFDQRKQSAIHGESEARNNAVFNVKQQYFNLVKAHRLAYVARESEKLSRDEETRAEALFQVGSVARGDVLKARARRATTQLTRIQAENQVEIQRQRLKQVIGVELSTSLDVDPSVQDYQIALPDSAAVIAQALRSRPALSSAKAAEDAARTSLLGAKSTRLPVVRGSVDVERVRTEEDLELTGFGDLSQDRYSTQWSGSLRLSFPIFTGFATEGDIRSAKGALLEQESARRQLVLDVSVEVQQAWLLLKEAIERVSVAQEGVASAEEDHKFSKGRYELGAGTYLDLLTAEVGLQNQRQQLVEAAADARVAEAALERAIGERRY